MQENAKNIHEEVDSPVFTPFVVKDGDVYLLLDVPPDHEWLDEIHTEHPQAAKPGELRVTVNGKALMRMLLFCQRFPRMKSFSIHAAVQAGDLGLCPDLGMISVYPNPMLESVACELSFYSEHPFAQFSCGLRAEFPKNIQNLLSLQPNDPEISAMADAVWLMGDLWDTCTDVGVALASLDAADLTWLYATHKSLIQRWLHDEAKTVLEVIDFQQELLLDKPSMVVCETTLVAITELLNGFLNDLVGVPNQQGE